MSFLRSLVLPLVSSFGGASLRATSVTARALAGVALLAAAGLAQADGVASLQQFVTEVKSGRATFNQTVTAPDGKRKKSTTGTFEFQRPNQFRFSYDKPAEQLIIGDGKKVWVYDPDLSQVTVRPQGAEEQNSPLAALIEPGKLERDFDVSELAGTDGGLQWLTLTPKRDQEASFQIARLGFGEGGLAKLQVTDSLGQRTEIAFSGWKKNPAFAKGTFTYTPGKGVDVVGEN